MDELESKIGYNFKDKSLLSTALTHSSFANENKRLGVKCNERLEFLGDAVLGVTTAEELYRNNPEMPEGMMTRTRSELVCEVSLAKTAHALNLGKYIKLGKGEEKNGGRTRDSILADAVEAIIAAIFLDGGEEPAKNFIFTKILYTDIDRTNEDYKTELQELVQRDADAVLDYVLVTESGPDHRKEFTVSAIVNGKTKGTGVGKSKKEAEQAAAAAALKALKNEA